MGEYDAAIVPTAPGDYTFHITGTIHGQKVDISVTSGDETFDAVKETSNLQFPSKLPSAAEVATHLDRVDSRVSALQDSSGQYGAAITAAQSAASAAQAAADRALVVGTAIGGIGLIVGLLSLAASRRASRASRA